MVRALYLAVVVVVAASLTAVGVLVYTTLAAPKIEVHSPFLRRGTASSGVFFIAHNHGLLESCIVAAEMVDVPGFRVELHKTEVREGKVVMVPVSKICVPGGGEVKALGIEGDGYHLMILGKLPDDIKKVRIRLYLENGSSLEFEAAEQELEVPGADHHGEHMGGQ